MAVPQTPLSSTTGKTTLHRVRWAAAVGAVPLLFMAACGSASDAGGADDSSSTTVTFVTAQPDGAFDEVIAGFEEANPDVTIKEQVVPFDDLNSTVLARVGSKDSSIDVYDVDEPRIAALAARGLLADISDLEDQAAEAVPEGPMGVTTYQGKLYALPRWTSTQILYYNTDLLSAAGVAAPPADPDQRLTWQQVAEGGASAQQAGAEWGFSFDQVDRYYQLQPLPESLGGGPGLDGEKLLEGAVTTEGWGTSMDWYASTFADGLSPRGIDPEQTPTLFSGGKTAFFAGGPWHSAAFDEVEGLNYGVAPYPYFEGGEPATSTDSWAIGLSPFSENQEAAKKFLTYMTVDPEGASQASAPTGNIPVQEEAFTGYLEEREQGGGPRGTDIAALIRFELDNTAVSRPTTVGYVDFETVMNKAFADIRNGAPVAARLDQADQEIDRALAKFE